MVCLFFMSSGVQCLVAPRLVRLRVAPRLVRLRVVGVETAPELGQRKNEHTF
jgi:hypothetical protein